MTVRHICQQESHPLLDTPLWESFETTVDHGPDEIAVIDGDRQLTRRELADLSAVASARLAAGGVRRFDRVVVKGQNSLQTVVAGLAASRLGAVLVPVSHSQGRREIAHICDTVEPAAVICDSGDVTVPALSDAQVITFAELAGGGPPVAATPLAVDDVAVVGFTAGTTGQPKGVQVSSAALNYTTTRWAQVVGLQPGDRVLALLPVSYLSGYAYAVHLALSRGMAVVCLAKWDPERAIDLLVTHRCAWSTSITTHVIMMVDAARRAAVPPNLSHMRALTCGGSPIPDELVDQVESVLGVRLLRAYGLTECLGAAMMRPDDPIDHRRRYDGFPVVGTDVEAFDDKGTVLPRGSVGIAGLRGPAMFTGYYGDPELTAAQFGAAGFLMTGDLIVRDSSGYVKVVGRAGDFIIRGGMNIYPVEIEELLRTHPAVADVAVVGYPDARLGERACACVVVADGASFSFEAMAEHLLATGLSKNKLPERYVEVDRIPISEVGKPLKSALRALIAPQRAT